VISLSTKSFHKTKTQKQFKILKICKNISRAILNRLLNKLRDLSPSKKKNYIADINWKKGAVFLTPYFSLAVI
jgi:hypothetical protein